ncbi:hypothetical protein [Microcella sp.]|uniref:hypothetical protein n=1 Tax=Microcella sp. TaxID=1913979 RepID=UPI00255EF0F4|nr:hypothetical protein [Microcella sp.]MBX9470623.1 hypothetical protein [Microcella sp.]
MPPAPRWISISAASALGLGIVAAGAVGVANALPLVDSTTQAQVPPISTVPGDSLSDVKGSAGTGDVTFPVPSSTPAVSSTVAPTAEPAAPVQQAPAPAPRPVAPDSVSPASPASVDSAD